MESNTFLFDPVEPNIRHSRFGKAQVVSTYVPSSRILSMASKDQTHFIKPLFLISQFRKYCRSGKPPKETANTSFCSS